MTTIEGSSTPYTDYFDPLVALVTHLSATQRKSRTVPNLARDLGFSEKEARTVVEGFRGLFRQSRTRNASGERSYAVHLRHARRPLRGAHDADDEEQGPLESEEISALLQLVSSMVTQEKETSRLLIEQKDALHRLRLDLEQRDRSLRVTGIWSMLAASLAAIAAIFAAFHNAHG